MRSAALFATVAGRVGRKLLHQLKVLACPVQTLSKSSRHPPLAPIPQAPAEAAAAACSQCEKGGALCVTGHGGLPVTAAVCLTRYKCGSTCRFLTNIGDTVT
jgi:hypothetical protein